MNDIGYLYVLGDGNRTKIGKSKQPEKRLRKLINTCGVRDAKVFISKECSRSSKKEGDCHSHFSSLNIHSEWFSVPFDVAVEFVDLTAGKEDLKAKKEEDYLEEEAHKKELSEFTSDLTKNKLKPNSCNSENFATVFKDTLEIIDFCEDSALIDQLIAVDGSLEKLLIVRCMALSDLLKQSHDAISYYQCDSAG